MKRLGSIIVWSAIAAAFIGPGTVTAAASAGADIGTAILWAVLFSGIATFTLQEFAARLAIGSGSDLAAILRRRYPTGPGRVAVLALVGGAILLGCAAYEAGNILGGVAGAMLAIDIPRWALTLMLGTAAAALLFAGSPRQVAQAMALFVAVMGFGFLLVAISLAPSPAALASGMVPDPELLSENAGLLGVLALVGTTVVPYNLFLGSALARGQGVGDMRFGLAIAVGLGTLITAAILVVGTALDGPFSFEALAEALSQRLGSWARTGLALGLLAAGLSSAITAPLAAALTARGLFADGDDSRWHLTRRRFRSVWAIVLLTGVGLGLADLRPGPAIVAAQAFNGALLPLVAIFLLAAMNDRTVLGSHANGRLGNAFGIAIVTLATTLGLLALMRAVATILGTSPSASGWMVASFAAIGLMLGVGAVRQRQIPSQDRR